MCPKSGLRLVPDVLRVSVSVSVKWECFATCRAAIGLQDNMASAHSRLSLELWTLFGVMDPSEKQKEPRDPTPGRIQVQNCSYEFSSFQNYSHIFNNNGTSVLLKHILNLHLEKESFIIIFSWSHLKACGILVIQPGIKPVPFSL